MEGRATEDVGVLSPLSDVEVEKLTLDELEDQLWKNGVEGASMAEFIDEDQADSFKDTLKALGPNTSLRVLHLDNNEIGDSGAKAIGAALEINSSLRVLYLANNEIGDIGATAIGAALEINSSLQVLHLYNNKIGDTGATAIGTAIKNKSSSLQVLHVDNNWIGKVGAEAIAEGLKENESLRELHIYRNEIGDDGAEPFGEALELNSSLQMLQLHNNRIGDSGAKNIGAGLKENSSLQILHLNGNRIGHDGATAIAEALEHNSSLHVLHLSSNQIQDSGASSLGSTLKQSLSLQVLNLSNNQIGDIGAREIGVALEHNSTLQQLRLDNNQIGDSGATVIGQALIKNSSLQLLHLFNNHIRDKGATAIGKALERNSSLRELKLCGLLNHIGDVGSSIIFSALRCNTTLTALDLQHCPIRTLGTEFLSTQRLENCTLSLRKLVWPPNSLAAAGRDAVYAFLRAVQTKCTPLARSRAMFVGAGGSGKTTLKTALLLRGAGARETLQQFRSAMIETIQVRWNEADLQMWVDVDLANKQGFFRSCPEAEGLTGRSWLELSSADVARIFGHPSNTLSSEVVSKMNRVLNFLKPRIPPVSWWNEFVCTLTMSRVRSTRDAATTDRPQSEEAIVPYGVLLNIPHVWTEGVELDTRWEEYTLWDFPGQMELYPSHQLFLACETAVYVLVVNGRTNNVTECTRQLFRWLSLIRTSTRNCESKVVARIVVTHTDAFLHDRRQALLREVFKRAQAHYGEFFDFGSRCYVTIYNEENGGDVDCLRTELVRLRSVAPPNRPLPASYQAICDDVLTMAHNMSTWPVVSLSAIDWRGHNEALLCLEDLGYVRRAGKNVILDPITWLSKLMSAFLHPFHGITARPQPPLSDVATAASLREHHLACTLVNSATACQIVNMRREVVQAEHELEVLPLLAHFDVCFSPLDDGSYVFPTLLPRVTSLPSWLRNPFKGPVDGRRYVWDDEHGIIPSPLTTQLMQRVVAMGRRLQGKPLFFGRGTVIMAIEMACEMASTVTVHVSDDDRTLDILTTGPNRTDLLSGATLHLVSVLRSNYRGSRLTKHQIIRVRNDKLNDPFIQLPFNHPLLGACRVKNVTTFVKKQRRPISPKWLQAEYENTLGSWLD